MSQNQLCRNSMDVRTIKGGEKTTMTQKLRSQRVLGLTLVLAIMAFAAGAAKPAKEIPISMTFRDSAGDRVKSDYYQMSYIDGAYGVRAVFVALGNATLDTQPAGSSGIRKLFLDFSEPVPTTQASPPFTTQSVTAFLSTSAAQTLQGTPIDDNLLGMAVGQIAQVNLNIDFNTPGLGWFIRFGPEYSGATKVLVTRTTSDTWIIEAAGANDIAKLLSYPTKGKFVQTDHGNYHMPCELTVKLK
jgi:hypothetical protein